MSVIIVGLVFKFSAEGKVGYLNDTLSFYCIILCERMLMNMLKTVAVNFRKQLFKFIVTQRVLYFRLLHI